MKHVVVMMFCLRSINTSGYSWPDGCSSLSRSVFGSFLLRGSLESIILCSFLQSYEAISSRPLALSYFTTVNNIPLFHGSLYLSLSSIQLPFVRIPQHPSS